MQVEYLGVLGNAIARLAYELPLGMVHVLVVLRVVEQMVAHFHVGRGPVRYVAVIGRVLRCVARFEWGVDADLERCRFGLVRG